MFTVSLLKYWAQEYADKLAELLHAQLTRSSGTPKRKGHRSVAGEVRRQSCSYWPCCITGEEIGEYFIAPKHCF